MSGINWLNVARAVQRYAKHYEPRSEKEVMLNERVQSPVTGHVGERGEGVPAPPKPCPKNHPIAYMTTHKNGRYITRICRLCRAEQQESYRNP